MPTRVLIVEDEILVALDLEAKLEDFGYEPVGIAADTATAYLLADEAPEVALVDLNLRDGLTGPQIGATLAERYGVAVLYLTANPRLLDDSRSGAIGVMGKPCDADSLRQAVEYALKRGEVEPPESLMLFE